jgi:hypothetical protein
MLLNLTRECAHCGDSFTVDRPSRPYRYCSNSCSRRSRFPLAIERVRERLNRTPTCWLYTGSIDSGGYGRISEHGRGRHAHVIAFEDRFGPVPEGHQVCHTCDTPNCCRNDDEGRYAVEGVEYVRYGHLWLGTSLANQRDKVAKQRQAQGLQHGWHTRPDARPLGAHNGNARLTETSVAEIRRLYAAGGVSQDALAAQFCVDQDTISNVVRGLTWRHI